jgi:poly-gamma-glutamate capsule biosynthesis protein CapA/YwtB (metallophosphatase superfamily)
VEAYAGPLYHAFFHFLIAYPDIAFSTSYGKNLDRDCVTPTEFRRSLEEFYRNGFVLVNLNDYAGIGADGTVTKKTLMVPVGKKPLILSFDDINYYSKNHGIGICDKVVLDENGKLAMLTVPEDGTDHITYDNDVIPMLEAFCEEYPDFSPFGDKGLLCLTGYDGILGYRTQSDSPNRSSESEAVKPVVQALKDAGWYFGSHSYSHFHMVENKSNDLEQVKRDTRKWRDEVGSLVGDTSIYIFPYGERPAWDDPKFLSLIGDGFPLLMGVGITKPDAPPYEKWAGNYFFMDRWFIDGTSLRRYPDRLAPLLDAATVYCPEERDDMPITAPVSAGAVYYNGDPVYRAVTVALGGDVSLAGSLGARLAGKGPDAVISPELASLFRSADIAMVNLESAVSDRGEPWPGKDFAFRADPGVLDFLCGALNTRVVSLANNHSIDYGFDAFSDTLARLDGYGIGYTGGGADLERAMEPYVVDVDGVTVAFLAASQIAPNMEWYAKKDSPGLLMAYDPALIVEATRSARALYDYVIVYMHWGREHEREPAAAQVITAHKLVDAGADAVIGAHPHCVQSFEVYNGRPVAYSLGNFLMYNHYDNTAVVVLYLRDGRAELEIIPCRAEGALYTSLAEGRHADGLMAFWRSLSPDAVIGEDRRLR